MNTYIVTGDDLRRITDVLGTYRPYMCSEFDQMVKLKAKLAESVVVDVARLSPDVVTMDSTVCIVDLADHVARTYTLVYPTEAKGTRLSLFSPLGVALLGASEGRIYECSAPGAAMTFAVRKVLHQPEREKRISPSSTSSRPLASRP